MVSVAETNLHDTYLQILVSLCRIDMTRETKYDDEAKQNALDAVNLKAMERELNLT